MTHKTVLPSAKTQRNLAKILWLEAKYEVLKAIRIPVYAISSLVFPMMFYILFGLLFNQGDIGSVNNATYLLATYGAFGVIGASLFGFGVSVATERGQGWMRLKRVSPMPTVAYFWAKVFVALLFSTGVILGLFLLGFFFGHVQMPLTQWLSLFGVLILGVFPFSAMGLMFGYLAGPNSAPAILNLIYLPMSFLSGLWIPINFLPKFIQSLAPVLPPYHYAQLSLSILKANVTNQLWLHLAALAGYTVLFLILAVILYRRDEGKTYG
jgi:ABC-2 type transport system permease protein